MKKERDVDKSDIMLNSIIASATFEGYVPSKTIKKDLRDYMDNRVSLGELIERTKKKYVKIPG
ncbi:MAG: antitoxin VbhA family protein [Negativicutes bacterium]|jgi:hypothetical protein